jgi:hypothetical protein
LEAFNGRAHIGHEEGVVQLRPIGAKKMTGFFKGGYAALSQQPALTVSASAWASRQVLADISKCS